MEIVKRNIVSIICGVVALIALVFYLVGVKPRYSALEESMTKLTSKPDEIRKVRSNSRTLPQVSESQAAAPLKLFPNERVIKEGQDLVARLKKVADSLVEEAVKINRGDTPGARRTRALLVENSLPRPTPDSLKFNFRREYIEILKPGGRPANGQKSLPDTLGSVVPPSETEIAQAKLDLWNKTYVPQLEYKDGVAFNYKDVAEDYNRAIANFDEEYRRERAMKYKVYLDPGALATSPNITTGAQGPSVEAMWYAQVALWIQQDVCRAISAMNKDSLSIPTSPIKHLISVDIHQDQTMYVMKGATQGIAPLAATPTDSGASAAPAGPVVDIDAKDYTLSPTGRVCNRLYDVVQFNVTAVLDAKAVKPFIQQLQYNQFINVLESDLQGVDLDQSLDEGYEYGKRPVVEVRLRCEALFLRDWTAWIPPRPLPPGSTAPPPKPIQGPMPLEVQKVLGIPSPLAPRPQVTPSADPTMSS
jgi:hypothetical protein